MEEFIKIAAIGIIGAIFAVSIKKKSPEMALLLTIAICVLILYAALSAIGSIRELVETIADTAGISPAVLEPVFKTVAIGIVAKISADICKDAGEGAVASVIETAGAAAAIFVSIPLIRAVLDLITSFM